MTFQSEIRQQLRNQSLEELITTTITTVGNRVFPDAMAALDLEDLISITSAWQKTHVATYGNVKPNSGVLAEGIADGGGLEPANNQVIDVIAISLANAGAGPVEVSVRIGDLPIVNTAVAPNGVTSSELGAIFPLTLSKGNALKFVVTSGTSADFSAKIAYNFRSS